LRRTGWTDLGEELTGPRSRDVGNDKIDENIHVVTERDVADEPPTSPGESRKRTEDRTTAATGPRPRTTSA
jgi:hypothetical protein